MPNRIVLAEYFTTEDVTLLFGVRADWDEPKVVEIKRPLSEIRDYVLNTFSLQTAVEENGELASTNQVKEWDLEEWQEKFKEFIEPLKDWSELGDYIYLVPHDVLHYLPLHTLQLDGQYLIERNPVLYTPSASVLKYCQAKRKNRRENILVFGDSNNDLPNAPEEAWRIAELFQTEPYLGTAVKKSFIKEKLAEKPEAIDILHFSCHGYFHPHQPLKSGILMADEENGRTSEMHELTLHKLPIHRYLTAEEFFGIEMNADLVTLSACESGVNEVRPGDELFGLMRALIYSGTPSVVMSLWRVEDISSGLLMYHFYSALQNEKLTKVEALQQAQLKVMRLTAAEIIADIDERLARLPNNETERRRRLKRSRQSIFVKLMAAGQRGNKSYPIFSNPFYWSPFILVGDWQ